MSKKWKKSGATKKNPENDAKPSESCRYNPTSIQTVSIKETANDEQWKTDQKTFWGEQLRRATRLNVLTAIGVLFAGIAASGAILYGWIAFSQWRDLRHNFEVDQRAWLKVEVEMPARPLNSQTPVVVTVRNVGKSPALKLFGGVIVQVVDAKSAPSYPPSGKGEMRQVAVNMIFPADLTTFSSGRTPNNLDGTMRPLSDDEMRSLSAGDSYLAAFGIIAYQDQFGDHWTRFCAPKSYQAEPKDFYWRSCILWNAVGDGLARWGSPS